MAIASGDVKLLKSAVMADVPEGGGAPTGVAIADGVSNAIFPDISELDRAGGRVNLRKSFVSVQTDDTDTYFGANAIVAEPPQDRRVSVTLFSTGKTFDTRVQAQRRVEAYLNKGPQWAGYLFENHIAGQRVIQLFQRTTDTVPNVGQTLVLIEYEGLSTQKEQYIRATAVSVVERSFTYDGDKDYKAAVVTVAISDALRHDFTGSPASRAFAREANATLVRDTVVADAGTYVGVVPLVQAATVGDFTIRAASIYTQLVPSAQTETPISFAPPYAASGLPVPSAVPVGYTAYHAWTPSIAFNLPGGCQPGTLSIATDGITIVDDAGLLKTAGTVGPGQVGTIDYANGILRLNTGAMSNAKAVNYTPAAHILRAPQSSEIPVTAESRSQSYVGTVNPVPQPGTLAISYMAQGRWYVLSDAGNGALKGLDSSYGAGSFNRNTGAFVVTLGALPDAGSSLVLTWNTPTQETQHPLATLQAAQVLQLAPPEGKAVQPGSLTVTWEYGGSKTATAATTGILSGAASGTLSVARNRLEFAPHVLPPVGAQLTVNYTAGPKQHDAFSHPSRNAAGLVAVTATLGAITPGSLEIEWDTVTDTAVLNTFTTEQMQEMGVNLWSDPTQYARDDGNGAVLRAAGEHWHCQLHDRAGDIQPRCHGKNPTPGLRRRSNQHAQTLAAELPWNRLCERALAAPDRGRGCVALQQRGCGQQPERNLPVPARVQAAAGPAGTSGCGHRAADGCRRASLGRQRPRHAARVHHQWLDGARQHQLSCGHRGAHFVDSGSEQCHHPNRLRDHGRGEHLQRVCVSHRRRAVAARFAVNSIRARNRWHTDRDRAQRRQD